MNRSFDDLVRDTDLVQSEVLPDTTCECYEKGRASPKSCKKCCGTGLVKNPKFPHDGKCKIGHIVVGKKRFWELTGRVLPKKMHGIYCDDCIKVVNALAAKIRKRKYGS